MYAVTNIIIIYFFHGIFYVNIKIIVIDEREDEITEEFKVLILFSIFLVFTCKNMKILCFCFSHRICLFLRLDENAQFSGADER